MPRKRKQQPETTKKTESNYLLVLIYPPGNHIDPKDVIKICQLTEGIKSNKDNTNIDVVLHSSGGDIYSSYKIINILRNYCKNLKFIVPLHAKSAATLMVLGSDVIIMGPQSELGPLDLPIEHPTAEGIQISALDGVRPLEYLASTAVELAFRLGLKIRQEIGLGRKESIETALDFASKYIVSIVSKLDPSLVNLCYRELNIATRYGHEFLKDYMFKNQLDSDIAAENAIHNLVWNYPSHGFAIGSKEAKKLGLRLVEAHKYPNWNKIWTLTLALIKKETKTISLISGTELDSLLNEVSSDINKIGEETKPENKK